MAIVVESTASNSVAGSTTLTITKPTGLAVGDLLIANLGLYNGTYATPAGWTLEITQKTVGRVISTQVFYKVADSSDVAASNFSFNSGVGEDQFLAGSLMRVTGFNGLDPMMSISDDDFYSGSQSITGSFTGTIATPNNSLVIMLTGATRGSGDGVFNFNAYGVTGVTASFTETFDFGRSITSNSTVIGGAYANITTGGTITAWSTTVSTGRREWSSILLVLEAKQDATASNNFLEVQPATFQPVVTNTNTVSNALLEVSPTINETNALAMSKTQWQSPTKESTNWTNENL